MPLSNRKISLVWIAMALLTTAVFVVDVLTPLGQVPWIPYLALPVIPILMAIPLRPFAIAIGCTALIILGHILSPPGAPPWVSVFNRSFGVVVLWTVAGLASLHMRNERRLRETQMQLQSIITSAMDAIISVDEDQRIMLFNAAAETMFRCAASEAVGRSLDRFIPERFREAHGKHIRIFGETSVANRRAGALGTVTGFRADGTEFPVEASISQVEVAGKRFFTAILRDITERKQAEEALQESRQAIERHREELQALAAQLLTTQEDERRRLARDLHDDVNQRLAAVAVELEKLAGDPASSRELIQERLRSVHTQVARLSDDVHDLAYALHPSVLDDLGLEVALRAYAEEFTKRTGVRATFAAGNLSNSISRAVATCLYRVAQEALRNVGTHARASHVALTLEEAEGGITLCVTDSGVGFDPVRAGRQKAGLGLVSLEERVRQVNGTFILRSRPGEGTQIHVWVPLTDSEAV